MLFCLDFHRVFDVCRVNELKGCNRFWQVIVGKQRAGVTGSLFSCGGNKVGLYRFR